MKITYKVIEDQDIQHEQLNMLTKGVSVERILQFHSVFQAVFVPANCTRMIKKVSVIELKEFSSWLKGNELALTTLQNFHTKELQLSLLDKLIKGNVACLVFHPGNDNNKYQIFEETILHAKRFNFPVFQLFPTVTYAEIIELIFKLELKGEDYGIDVLKETNKIYFQYLSHNINIKEALYKVQNLSKIEMLLTDVSMKPITVEHLSNSSRLLYLFESKHFTSFINQEDVFKLFINCNRIILEVEENHISTKVLAEPITNNGYLRSVIFMMLDSNQLFSIELLKTTVEALSIVKEDNSYEDRTKVEAAGNRELFERNNFRKAESLYEKLELKLSDKLSLIVMEVTFEQVDNKVDHMKYVKNLKMRIAKYIEPYLPESDFSSWYKNKLVLFISSGTKHYKHEITQKLADVMYSNFSFVNYFVGISSSETDDLYMLYKESLAAIDYGKKHKKKITSFQDIGFLQVFTNCANDDYLIKYYENTLRPILALELSQQGELLITLESFVDHNLNFKDTAENLYVHPNTVRYRIQKIKEIFGDGSIFTDPSKRFNIYFALKLLSQYSKSDIGRTN